MDFKFGKELIGALYAIRNAILGKEESDGGNNSDGGNTKYSPYTWHDTPIGLIYPFSPVTLFFVPIEFCTSITKINQYLLQTFGFDNPPSPMEYSLIRPYVVYDKTVNVLNCVGAIIGGRPIGDTPFENDTFANSMQIVFLCEESANLFVCMNFLEYYDDLSLSDIQGLPDGCNALYVIQQIASKPISSEPGEPGGDNLG